jgi:hypothetical protein
MLPVGGISQSEVAESSSGDAIGQTFDNPEDNPDNVDEDDAEQYDGSGSEEAGNHSMFLIDQLNEVESTQVEDLDSNESSGAENDEPNLDLKRVLDADNQPESEEVIFSKIEKEVLDKEIQELAREDPEFNAQELIDQGTPIPTETIHTFQSADFGIETTRQETIEVRKAIFATVENGSGLEDTKERIPTHLMDNPTSDDYLYEARMKETTAFTTVRQIQSPESTQQAVELISNPPVTVASIDSSSQSEPVIFTNTEECYIKDGGRSDGEREKVDKEVSMIENPNDELQSTSEVSEKIDITAVTQDLDTSFSSSSEENVGPKADDSSSAVESASEAENEDAKVVVSKSEVAKDEEARATAIQADLESAEGEDNNDQVSKQSDKENQDSDPKTKVIKDDEQEAVEDEAESSTLDINKSPSIEQQQYAMNVEEDEVIHPETSTHESKYQNKLAPQRDSNAEDLESESQGDVEMGEIDQDDEELNHTDLLEQKEKINSFLDKLIQSRNDENADDRNVKDKVNDDNHLVIDMKSHVTSDENDDDETNEKSSKEEEKEPIVTKPPLRRTRQMRVAAKKSAFLAEVIKQQKRKTQNAAAAAAKEEKVSTEVASPSPLATSPAATAASKRSQKERKAKLETTKEKRASQRSQSESSTRSLTKAMSNSPPHMSLRSGRRIATGTDSTAPGTKPATTTTKGGRGKRSGMEAGNTVATKGPVNKKSSASGGAGKRKGRGKAGKR